MLAAGMRQQWQTGFSHSLPKRRVFPIAAIDVMAIGQALHHHSALLDAAIDLIPSVLRGLEREVRVGQQLAPDP